MAAGGVAAFRGGDGAADSNISAPAPAETSSNSQYDTSEPQRNHMVFYIVETDEPIATVLD